MQREMLNTCFNCRRCQLIWSQRKRRQTAWSRTRTDLALPCRSCVMSCRKKMNSRPKCSCYRKSWHITKGMFLFLKMRFDVTYQKQMNSEQIPSSIYLSEEFEEDVSSIVCAPSPPPSSASTDQPESGIRRL